MQCKALMCIGGGDEEYSDGAKKLHRHAVDMAEKPGEALIIPTPCAIHSFSMQVAWFRWLYGEKFGFRVKTINLEDHSTVQKDIRSKIQQASIIYIPGGNTQDMLALWKQKKVIAPLQAAFQNNAHTVFVGSSAGAIYPFSHGVTSSTVTRDDCGYGLIRGIGWLKGTVCPHYSSRKYSFRTHMQAKREGAAGVGIDDHCALIREQKQCTVVSTKSRAHAVLYTKEDGHVRQYPLCGTFPIKGPLSNAVGIRS